MKIDTKSEGFVKLFELLRTNKNLFYEAFPLFLVECQSSLYFGFYLCLYVEMFRNCRKNILHESRLIVKHDFAFVENVQYHHRRKLQLSSLNQNYINYIMRSR